MNKFLLFITLTLALIIFLIFITKYLSLYNFKFKLPKNTHALIVGDSHPASALNDEILTDTYNLAQPASSYFYSYVKIREFIDHNPTIDTLILGYSYGDFKKSRDLWFTSSRIIKFKIRNFFFLFNFNDYKNLVTYNPADVLVHTPQVILYNLITLARGLPALGEYSSIESKDLEQAISELKNSTTNDTAIEYSKYQEKYLLKIYKYCQDKNVKLILITTPIHPTMKEYQMRYKEKYCDLFNDKLKNAQLIDHSNFKIPVTGFADLEHLNEEGAKIYSSHLKKYGFKTQIGTCVRL